MLHDQSTRREDGDFHSYPRLFKILRPHLPAGNPPKRRGPPQYRPISWSGICSKICRFSSTQIRLVCPITLPRAAINADSSPQLVDTELHPSVPTLGILLALPQLPEGSKEALVFLIQKTTGSKQVSLVLLNERAAVK